MTSSGRTVFPAEAVGSTRQYLQNGSFKLYAMSKLLGHIYGCSTVSDARNSRRYGYVAGDNAANQNRISPIHHSLSYGT